MYAIYVTGTRDISIALARTPLHPENLEHFVYIDSRRVIYVWKC